MDILNFATATPIVIVCYLVGLACKNIKKLPDNWIPVIVAFVGMIIAIPAFFWMPNFPAEDIFTALAVGIMSGFASTGVNQVYKQIRRGDE